MNRRNALRLLLLAPAMPRPLAAAALPPSSNDTALRLSVGILSVNDVRKMKGLQPVSGASLEKLLHGKAL